MTLQEFKDYMINMNFTETERNTFTKSYDGRLELIYKVNKDFVNVYYKTFNRTSKRMKARLKHIKISSDNTLSGFKTKGE